MTITSFCLDVDPSGSSSSQPWLGKHLMPCVHDTNNTNKTRHRFYHQASDTPTLPINGSRSLARGLPEHLSNTSRGCRSDSQTARMSTCDIHLQSGRQSITMKRLNLMKHSSKQAEMHQVTPKA